MSNRVEELESTVAGLESTVQGLTEELVEAKERIRELEAEVETKPADGSTVRSPSVRAGRDEEEAETDDVGATGGEEVDSDKNTPAEEGDDEASPLGDDIIVA
jgi:seryl-tRNA synthetase